MIIDTKQSVEIANSLAKEIQGEEAVQITDLSQIVEVGQAITNAMSFEQYLKVLPDHIGRVVVSSRNYRASGYGILRDSWEFGSIKEKISGDDMDATEAMAWDLVPGQSYDPTVFEAPPVHVTFWNSYTPFEIKYNKARKQSMSAFSDGSSWSAFLSMIDTEGREAKEVRTDAFARATIAQRNAHNIAAGKCVVHVISMYNAAHPDTTVTAGNYFLSADFWRYFSFLIGTISEDMARGKSRIYNLAGYSRWTPVDRQLIHFPGFVKKATDVFLQSDTFHNDFTALPQAYSVGAWQGTGTDLLDFASRATISTKTKEGNEVTAKLLGSVSDIQSMAIDREKEQTRIWYNPDNDTDKTYLEWMAGQHIDIGENCVSFTAD